MDVLIISLVIGGVCSLGCGNPLPLIASAVLGVLYFLFGGDRSLKKDI